MGAGAILHVPLYVNAEISSKVVGNGRLMSKWNREDGNLRNISRSAVFVFLLRIKGVSCNRYMHDNNA